jgi:hypothetical protein
LFIFRCKCLSFCTAKKLSSFMHANEGVGTKTLSFAFCGDCFGNTRKTDFFPFLFVLWSVATTWRFF